MKEVMQKVFDPRKGDCVRACLASVFELPVDEVPNFWEQTQDPTEFWGLINEWLMENFGVRKIFLRYSEKTADCLEGVLCIASGTSPRHTPGGHAVVWRDGLLHDPHPSGDGLLGDPEDFMIFIPLDPRQISRKETKND